jgi:hypothetical protein
MCIQKGLKFGRTTGFSHHDNAPAHKALSDKQFLAQKSITEMKY